MAFDHELRECLAFVLGEELPPPEYDAALFYRHWLGGRNLGLVPIADADSFSWPGHWVACVTTADGDHAVAMYGSPSGPVLDPAEAYASGAVTAGWLVARLDLKLGMDRPYGSDAGTGTVVGLLVADEAEALPHRVDSARAIAGSGLEGDRYAAGRGTFSKPGGQGYELTVVDADVLDALDLPWEDARRNVVTRGIDLNALVDQRFSIGGVECVGRRLAEPCAHLERLTRPGLMRPLVHRAGLRADILVDGVIGVGDAVATVSQWISTS